MSETSVRPDAAVVRSPSVRRRYVIRVDASPQMGTGHLMRCLTLAGRLQQQGGEIHLIARSLPVAYLPLIAAGGHALHRLASATQAPDIAGGPAHAAWLGATWQEDADQTAACVAALGGADVLIIDHYAIDRRWERVLRPLVGQICVIDDLADRLHDCDVLLDQNYFPEPAQRYRGLLPAHCRLLCGPGHGLLRPDFLHAAATLRVRDGQIRRVLVFYGGADPDNLTGLTLDALAPQLGAALQADVVVGAINPHVAALRARCDGQPHLRLHVQAAHMADLMAAADLAFGACGTATWERCLLGLPTIVVVLADNQREPTRALVEAGVVVSLGEAGALGAQDLARAFERLAADPATCRAISARARSIMQAEDTPIEDLLSADPPFVFEDVVLRFASRADSADLRAWRNQDDVRAHSRSQEPVAAATHAAWLAAVLADPARHLMIGYRDGAPIGVLRLDEQDEAGEVSIYLTPQARGRHHGSALLQAQEAWVRAKRPLIRRLTAVVLDGNQASQRLFLNNGYTRLPTHYEKRISR